MMDRLVCADGGNPDPTRTQGKNAFAVQQANSVIDYLIGDSKQRRWTFLAAGHAGLSSRRRSTKER
jgi:hypothetical protein